MKKEDLGTSDCVSLEHSSTTDTPEQTPRRKRGRPRKKSVEPEATTPKSRAKKGKVNDVPDVTAPETPAETPARKRGRKKKDTSIDITPNGSSPISKPTTKAGLAGTNEKDTYSYSDLFPGDDDHDDENVDAADDDSEYAPSDEEMTQQLSNSAGKRRGASSGTRRQTRSMLTEPEPEGSTDEDEAGESESEFDEDDEEDLAMEHTELTEAADPVALFEDEPNRPRRDVYDFDAQSILSDQRVSKKRQSSAAHTQGGTAAHAGARSAGNAIARVASHRSNRRNTTGLVSSWGSNIYSALAASLRTRADLDAYSTFLKSAILNDKFDRFLAELCKPSNQHVNLFYGVSASLQSLMSRINDYDKVVELLHAFVARSFDQMQHRVTYLSPIVHQPLFGLNYVPSVTNSLNALAEAIDKEMVIKPSYVLNQDTTLLAMPNSALNEFGVSTTQYNLITGSGNMGRFMPDIKQLIVSTELYNKLTDLIALPPERVYEVALSRAHQRVEEPDIDISPIEPPNLQRLMMVVDSDGVLLGIALLDYWDKTEALQNRPEPIIDLVPMVRENGNDAAKTSSTLENHITVEEQVKEVLDEIIDWTVLKSDPKNVGLERPTKATKSKLGQLHFMDAFLLKPNGRRDHLLLVAHYLNCHPPLTCTVNEVDAFRIYSVVDEGRFLLEKHGFAPEMPIALDGVHTADPDELMEEQSLLVVPDLLYDTLRKVLLRELISSTGAATALLNPQKPDSLVGPVPVMQCTKFVILDRLRRVPLAIVFDSPVRLALQVSLDNLSLHPFGEEASKQFDHLTPAELKSIESAFKPTTADYRLVTIGGLLYGLQIDDQRIVRRVLEITPARFEFVFPHSLRPSMCAQSVLASAKSCPSSVRIVNDETNSSTVLPAFFYPHYERQKHSSVIAAFSSHLTNLFFDFPIQISLYDIMFRLGQKHMPELLARQHIEAAEAAAYAEAAANPHAPPPAPVPLPEHWGVCCICSKELRSPNGLLDHEMRHISLSRFRCVAHNTSFLDRRQWQAHMNELHSTARSVALAAALPRISAVAQADSLSDQEEAGEEEDVNDQEAAPGSGLLAGLAQVFSTGVLVGRMEAPQCEKCGDYFLNADVLTQHLDYCDGVSFCMRTPIPRAQKPNASDEPNLGLDATTVDADEFGTTDELGELKNDLCVCGMCGMQMSSREKIVRHFSTQHLQCILCNSVLRSLEELSCHYQNHLRSDASLTEETIQPPIVPITKMEEDPPGQNADEPKSSSMSKTLIQKLMRCDICGNFCGTKYNYYFHQWAEHGVVHPPLGSTEAVPQMKQHTRQAKQQSEKDDFYFAMTGVRRIKCKFCGLVVRVTGKEYINHLSGKHGVFASADVICRICAELFETPEKLSVHLGETHAPSGEYANAGVQTIFRCTHCEFWGFAKGLLKHSREAHGDLAPAMYECTHCYERFSDKRVWRTHMDKHNEGYSQRCLECGRAFRLRASLLHHVRTHHGDDQGPATCEYCGLTYPKRGSLRYHIFRMHNQELAHECNMCQRRFRLETELRRHVKEMHSGAVRCEICHKVCTNLRCYAQHRQKHFRTRIYQCTDCQATFKSKLAMKRHIRVEHLQLGPERFECQICGKIVTQIGMHMLIHKEARFECEYCNKRFTKAAYYNEHLRIHLGEQPFECHICQKRFNKKSNLNVHLKFHEKHRDDEGNYLELKPRGRISSMFGDALMSPSDRAARQAAAARHAAANQGPQKADAAVGSDLPGAFNVAAGPPGAAEEAAAQAVELFGLDSEVLDALIAGKLPSSLSNSHHDVFS
ncbi:Zinc finger protein [Paragonimus skrjabini miyazakii]|uniref:Zinc finger protein n=1 Tax=Paragonimus skrjabini miyazakii TaxID=59628 RepID=A0A8S9YGT1_9TREM|nr:Zinc finger protein [Paragonimus skrjabini miyazakii]